MPDESSAPSLNAKEISQVFGSLKASKYTLLKAENKLLNKHKEKLEQVKESSPMVGIMHSLKSEFHD